MCILLSFVDSVSSETSVVIPNLLRDAPSLDTVEPELLAQGKSFDQGIISSQRLLEVVVGSFMKLARKAVLLQGTCAKGYLDSFVLSWGAAVCAVFTGQLIKDSNGTFRFFPVRRPLKRAELVKALVKTKLLEVYF